MGHREDLLAGAKRCIAEKGYAHTTARDVVAASGTNLASIGYHYGSKDALLDAAVVDSFDDWDDLIEAAVSDARSGTAADRLAALLAAVAGAVTEHRTTFASALQALARAEFAPDVRDRIADAHRRARRELPATLLPQGAADPDDRVARALGSLALALVNGLVLEQLVDGADAPSAADLADALRVLAG